MQQTVIALGYFDSVHKGHQKVIKTAKEYADKNGCSLTVFTFKGNLKAMLSLADDKMVYTHKERQTILKSFGVDDIYFAPTDFNFLSLSKKSFLTKINKKYNIKCYVSGKDYKFGKFGEGNVDFLGEWAKNNAQDQIIVEDCLFGGEKISTTRIKKLLTNGEIEKANELLGREYSITGKVIQDRKVGRNLGFPTLNVHIDNGKHRIKEGVYLGKTVIDKKEYRTILNYGGRPTFDLNVSLVEAHVIDYEGNLYDKEVTLSFCKYMREVKKFSGVEDLKEQLKKDLLRAREE